MNINKYGINSLLKLALIISIFFRIANSLSAQEGGPSQQTLNDEQSQGTSAQSTKKENNDSPTLEENQSQQNQQNEKFQTRSKDQLSEPKISEQLTQLKKDLDNSLTKKIYIKNSLIFIDLPILATLLLLWFLTQNKQKQQIEQLTKNQNKIIGNFNQFNEVNNKLNNLDKINRQIIEKIQDNNQKNIDSEVRLRELLSNQQVNYSISDRNSLDFNSNTNFYSLNSIAIVDKVLQFVETYNQDKNSISDKAKFMVAETQASLNQRRSGNSNVVTLENTTQKKYCIIEEDNNNYLVPHAKIKFDDFNKSTLESLFDCSNFTAEYSDFQLVKPAKVSPLPSETWQLEEKGKLDFS